MKMTKLKQDIFEEIRFAHSDILFNMLHTKNTDIIVCATKLKVFLSHVQND
jgi:chemotaxis methyl-accepting protein methylase